jgi:hypothetical protein
MTQIDADKNLSEKEKEENLGPSASSADNAVASSLPLPSPNLRSSAASADDAVASSLPLPGKGA